MPDFSSPFYPYTRAPNANNTLLGAERIPKMLLTYLLDLPDANGYSPVDDNARPRVRFAKYVWNDGGDPLAGALPTPAEKISMLFDPEHPELNTDEEKAAHPKGYRLMWQHVRRQSILEEQTLVKCYLGRIFNQRPYHTSIGVRFDVWIGSGFETNMKTDVESRCFAIEQAIRHSLAPINMTGVGAFSFLRQDHVDNGSSPIYNDGVMVGRSLHCSVDWMDADTAVTDGMCEECT